MKFNDILFRTKISVRQAPLKVVRNIFLVYSVCWGLMEPVFELVPGAENYFDRRNTFEIILAIGLVGGIWSSIRPWRIDLKLQNHVISVEFNDLFKCEGVKVIPVSRFMFEIEVIQASLQSLLIKRFRDSAEGNQGIEEYRNKLQKALESKARDEIERTPERGIEERFPVGTTALIEHHGQEYLLLAVAETEIQGFIQENNSNATKLWLALDNLWKAAPDLLRARSINIPLLGSGISGIRLSPSQILEMNLLVLSKTILEARQITTGEIRVILHYKYFETIDLHQIKRLWDRHS